MDYADSQHLSRISKMLLAGIGVAFAWVLLSFTLGLSVSQAHAADDNGLLDTLTSTVEETTTAVIEPVAPVVEVVESTVTPIVTTVVTPTVTPVLTAVADATASGVVTPIVDSTLGVVDAVPVVGTVVSTIGADEAASAVGSTVDGVLQGATGAVVGTASAVIDTTSGTITNPAVSPLTALDSLTAVTTAKSGTDAAAGSLETLARAAYLAGAATWTSISSDLSAVLTSSDSAIVSGGVAGGIFALLRAALQADSVLMGPSGAGPGAWVLVALGFVVAYRAWMRRSGLENDVAPPAPVLSTDVSPD